MSVCGRQLPTRYRAAFAAALLGLLACSADAFFRPVPTTKTTDTHKGPIHVPTSPGTSKTPGSTSHGGGSHPPVDSAPEPNGLALALVGAGGLALFLVC